MEHVGMPDTIVLETERLLLKELTPELMEYIFKSLDAPDGMSFLGMNTQESYDLEKRKWKEGITGFDLAYKGFNMILKSTKEVVGRIGYHTWKPSHRRSEIGYFINNDSHKQKGYMKEAMKPLLIYGFENMNLNRIEAFVSPLNVPSIKLIERYGFTKEGLLRQHYGRNAMAEDSAVYGLLQSEYESIKHSWQALRK
jgi:[ribosomal protein S5]-alanine N-acetyltransferase